MGTTLVAMRCDLANARIHIAHVGDSRCYRLRDGVLTQLTTDHTMREVDPTVTGPGADHLSRAVGIEAETPIDLIMGRVVVGDLYLLCSDGLTKMVRQDDRIRDALLETRDLQMAVQRLIGMASIAGGLDNIAVVLVAVREQAALP